MSIRSLAPVDVAHRLTSQSFTGADLTVHEVTLQRFANSGAGTNLKAGGRAPVRRYAPEIFLVLPLHVFGSKSTISRFDERFCDG